MKKYFLGILLVILAVSSAGAAITPVRGWTDSGKVIAAAMGFAEQQTPVVVEDGTGGMVAAWVDGRVTSYAVYAMKLDSSGTKQWTPTGGVTVCAANAGGSVAVASDGTNFFIAWDDLRSGAGSGDIYVQKINSSGVPQWTENGISVVSDATLGLQGTPQIIADGLGGCIVTYGDARGGSQDIRAQKFNSSGTRQWGDSNGAGVCIAADTQWSPVLASDGSNGAIITWNDMRGGLGTMDIYAQKVASDGTVGGGSWIADGVIICAAANEQTAAKIISNGSGGAIITWMDGRILGSGFENIYAQKVANDGTVGGGLWVTDGVTICAAANQQYGPELCTDGAGGAIITWKDGRVGDGTNDIYAQKIMSDGSVGGGSDWPVNGQAVCTAAKEQAEPRIVSDGSGGAIITWYDNRVGSDMKVMPGLEQYDIYAFRINNDGTSAWGVANGVAVYTGLKGVNPRIITDGSHGAIIVFQDVRNNDTSYDIYAQKLNSSGSSQWGTGKEVCAAKKGMAQDQPVICAGTGVVAWRDALDGGQDIYAQKFDDSGNPLWTTVYDSGSPLWTTDGVAVCTDALGGQSKRNLGGVAKTGSNYIIVWEDQRDGNSDIYAQLLDSSGVAQWTAGGIAIAASSTNETHATVAPDGSGGAVIVWTNGGAAAGGVIIRVGAVSPDMLLANAYLSDDPELPGLNNPQIAQFNFGGPGGPGGPGGNASKIYAKRINSSGGFVWGGEAASAAGAGLLINTFDDPAMLQDYPSVANIGGGAVMVVWQDNRNDLLGGTYDIYAQKMAISNGARQLADLGVLVCNAANTQTTPRVAGNGDGTAVVAWADGRGGRVLSGGGFFPDTALYDVYAQKLDITGTASWSANGVEVLVETGSNSVEQPHVAVDSAGTSIIAFRRIDGTSHLGDIKIQALDTDGARMIPNSTSPSPFTVSTLSGDKTYPDIALIGTGSVVVSWDPMALVLAGADTDIHIQSLSGIGEVPAAPTLLIGTPEASIRWSWKDNSSDEDGFALFDGNDNLIVTLPANTVSFLEIDGLHPNTLYTRKVKANNAVGYSNASNSYSVYTLASIPTIQITETGADTITLGLTGDVNGSKYKWERGTGGSFTVIADNQTSTTCRDTRCQAETTYYYRVSAYNGDGVLSLPSATVSARLGAVVLKSPTVRVTSLGRSIKTGDYCEVLTLNSASQNTAGSIISTSIKILDKNNATVYEHTFSGALTSFDLRTVGLSDGTYTVTTRVTDTLNSALYTETTNQINYASSVQVVGGWGVAVGRGGSVIRAADAGQADFVTMGYHLTRSGDINLLGYSADGSMLMNIRIASGTNGAMVGSNSAIWDGRTPTGGVVPRGLYIIKMINNGRQIGKIAIPILAK